jgi:lysophospholipase L1-like esterase
MALTAVFCGQPLLAKTDAKQWVGTWASAPLLDAHVKNAEEFLSGATLREVAHVSIGGDTVRIRFSNLYGTTPLVIGPVEIAQTLKGASIVAGSGKPVTFNGQATVSIPPGALAVSDAVAFKLAPLSDLTVSFYLPSRLQADPKYRRLSVLNEGISGNKILLDGAGPSALARFDRDVIAQSGAKYLLILEGINDIGRLHGTPDARLTAADLISAFNQMVVRAHAHGIAVIGCTLTPYHGAGYYSENGEAIRKAVNDWIRTGGVLDGFVDLEAAVRDPNHPDTFLPADDPGDHLHPNDAGYKAMGDAIDLKLFTLKPKQP